jgi:hypothetical protein
MYKRVAAVERRLGDADAHRQAMSRHAVPHRANTRDDVREGREEIRRTGPRAFAPDGFNGRSIRRTVEIDVESLDL